jgi:hypothetical protein
MYIRWLPRYRVYKQNATPGNFLHYIITESEKSVFVVSNDSYGHWLSFGTLCFNL